MNLSFAQRALELRFEIIEHAQNFVLARFDFLEETGWFRRGSFGHGQRLLPRRQDPTPTRASGKVLGKSSVFVGEELQSQPRENLWLGALSPRE